MILKKTKGTSVMYFKFFIFESKNATSLMFYICNTQLITASKLIPGVLGFVFSNLFRELYGACNITDVVTKLVIKL